MIMRYKASVGVLFLLFSVHGAALAQSSGSRTGARVAGVAGFAEGPSPTGMLGFLAGWDLHEYLGVHAELSMWRHGFAACDDVFPSSCDGEGTAYLVGARGKLPITSWLEGYLRVDGGAYSFSGATNADGDVVGEGTRPAIGGEAGLTLKYRSVGLSAGWRRFRASDDEAYRDLIGEGLFYPMFVAGLELRLAL